MIPGGEPGVSDFGISSGEPAPGRGSGHGADGPAGDDPRFALADALRRVITAVVGANVPDDDLRAATLSIEAAADALDAAAGPGRRPRSQPDPTGHPQDFFPTSPVIGFANPIAPPVTVEAVDGALRGTAYFDYQYEGPPSCVHGGVIALVFDELLGAANIAAGQPGMTGTLTIRYRRPTPLRTPLRLEAGFVSRDGRKITTRGAIYDGDELTAEAEGIFIELVPERFIEAVGRHSVAAEVLAQLRADALRAGIATDALPAPTGAPGGASEAPRMA
jgi:acyl-coenzyme A thioesterase PaaI-like protein